MTSPSTLIRKARLAESRGHKGAATRLRAEAAKLRRAARNKKTPKKPTKAAERDEIVKALAQETETLMRTRSMGVIGPADMLLAQKDNPDFAIMLRRELLEARKTGENNAAAKYAAQIEGHNISVISGLIAIVEHAQKLNGSLPPTMALSGYMVAKVVEALRKAGYTRDGLDGSGTTRQAIASRVSVQRQGWAPVSDRETADQRG